MDEETKFRIGFSVFPGIGPVRFGMFLERFGSAKAAWVASQKDMMSLHVPGPILTEFISHRKSFDIDAYITRLRSAQASVISPASGRYPRLLAEIPDPPIVLFVKGRKPERPIDFEKTVAVVGTRKCTNYGQMVTRSLVTGLTQAGCVIVSGLAYGVDAVAHAAAIDAGGLTIAVMGCGVDVIAPRANSSLYERICDGHGAIISEMPLGYTPNKGLFPARNRIISGLSRGVLVTEGAKESGSLITAAYAAKQGRDVFAVPGPITNPMSAGPAILIKQGAKLVETAVDVLEELGFSAPAPIHNAPIGDTMQEQQVLDVLSQGPMHIDELCRKLDLTIRSVGSTITVLEMKGKVRDSGEKIYELAG